MWQMAWRRLLHRGARTLVLGFAILVSATGFTVLTASSSASRLETVGTVRAEASSVYDILVRPKGSRSELENTRGLVQPGFLSGIYGGIAEEQWRQIQQLSGVEVAAPIAMIGYAYPEFEVPVDTRGAWAESGTSVARVDVRWSGDNGQTRTKATPDYTMITDHPLASILELESADSGIWRHTTRSGAVRDICPYHAARQTQVRYRPEQKPSVLACFSRTRGGEGTGVRARRFRNFDYLGVEVRFPLPYVVAAIDPESENALVGLDDSRMSGESLLGASTDYPQAYGGQGIPVLTSTDFAVSQSAEVTIGTLPNRAGRDVLAGRPAPTLRRYRPTRSSSFTITAQDAHEMLLEQFRTAKPQPSLGRASRLLPGEVHQFTQVSQPTFDSGPSPMQVELSPSGLSGDYDDPRTHVPANDEPVARESSVLRRYGELSAQPKPVTLRLRGTFDPQQLSNISDLTDQMLAGYATAVTEGQDAASREALGGEPLTPSSNVGGFVQPPPTMITSLNAIGETMVGWEGFNRYAPISAVRVRVEGAGIYDEGARERIRLTAQRIQDMTGLDVDITTGASVAKQTMTLPAGKHGRPGLELSQSWVKKGVATTILQAVDKKSVALFLLVLLVSALSVANAAVAAVRARRTELGVLACVGWKRSHLFRSVLYELGLVAAAAGAVSVLLALLLGVLFDTPVSLGRALLAFPAALLVSLAAGAVPAMLAARADPMDAVRPVVSEPRRPRHAAGIASLARLNLGLSKTRTALAVAGLLIAVATSTMLLAIMLGFQGAVVGTVLGDAIAVQARTADYVATAATLLLACVGVTNVMYLNIRDRGTELATLRAVGWTERNLDRLVTTEGGLLGLLGTIPGVLLGIAAASWFAGGLTAPMLLGASIAWVIATSLAVLSAYAATVLVRRLPTTDLLTE